MLALALIVSVDVTFIPPNSATRYMITYLTLSFKELMSVWLTHTVAFQRLLIGGDWFVLACNGIPGL